MDMKNCHPEHHVKSPLVEAERGLTTSMRIMTGHTNWAVALGRHDIQHVISALSRCNDTGAPPNHEEQGGHISAIVGIGFSHLLQEEFPVRSQQEELIVSWLFDDSTNDGASSSTIHETNIYCPRLELYLLEDLKRMSCCRATTIPLGQEDSQMRPTDASGKIDMAGASR
jgi:hypothetical protein